MVRWEPNARARLEEAGIALFEERGFEQTTVADIAAAAGLTERTFFRYFTDKREVLFSGAPVLAALMVAAVASAPADASPQQAVRCALTASEEVFEGRRTQVCRRQHVLAANPVLLERELLKGAALADALACALRERGIADPVATLTAEVGLLVFRVGFARWLAEGGSLGAQFDATYAEVGSATTS